MDENELWSELKPLAEAGDSAGMMAQIEQIEDVPERIAAYRTAIRKMAFDPWENKTLDPMIALADRVIELCELEGGDMLQQANVICFNTSANLADCWTNGFPHEERHFRKGLAYAEKALWYREHLGKPAGAKALAMWAIGKHRQSLGMPEALDAFEECLRLETEAAEAAGKPAAISGEAPAGYLIAAGYVAIVTADQTTLDQVLAVCHQWESAGGEAREDAEIIAPQLRETARLYAPHLRV